MSKYAPGYTGPTTTGGPATPVPKKPLTPKKPLIKATGMAKGGSVKKAAPKRGMAMGGVAVSSGVKGTQQEDQRMMDAMAATGMAPKKPSMQTATPLPVRPKVSPMPRGPRGSGPTDGGLMTPKPKLFTPKPKATIGGKPVTLDPTKMAKGGIVKKGMAKGGMAKKGKC